MTDMFCYQCQQTAGNKGCIRTGRLRQTTGHCQFPGPAGLPADSSGGNRRPHRPPHPPCRPSFGGRTVYHPHQREFPQPGYPGLYQAGGGGNQAAGRDNRQPYLPLDRGNRCSLSALHTIVWPQRHGGLRPPRPQSGLREPGGHQLVLQRVVSAQPSSHRGGMAGPGWWSLER